MYIVRMCNRSTDLWVDGVGFNVGHKILWCGLWQTLEDALSLTEDLQDPLLLPNPLHEPSSVHSTQETSGTTSAYWPERLRGKE